tara:strand:- start:175 stop:807 length:633 start_codon:yes stop_codon:yes gene_type:complete
MKLTNVINLFIPKIFIISIRKIKNIFKNNAVLFNGKDQLFKENLNNALVYGEYGCGESTNYVLNSYQIPIYSVDTSLFWVNKFKNKSPKLFIKHIDVGEVTNWGVPKNYNLRVNFKDYANWLWQNTDKPDLVLIDGRFRVYCFLTSLKLCDEGTKIIFDDYDREEYHIVEEFIMPTKKNDQQALFVIKDKNKINLDKLNMEINRFMYVIN